MNNRIVCLRVKNFKCFDSSRFFEYRLDSSRNPVILSGPNGFGKTTFFDAVELIFAKTITRLDKGIEKSNMPLGKNLLLNEADKDGYIVLTLKDDAQVYTTLIAKISHDKQKIDIEKSVEYAVLDREVQTAELESFISDYNEWSDSLTTNLEYYKNEFSVYYYVSQAESVHFLKRSIAERKNVMNVMLKTDAVEEKIGIAHDLIGEKLTYKSEINEEIRLTDEKIKELVKKIKSISSVDLNKCSNIDMGLYNKNVLLFYWDNPQIENESFDTISKACREVEALECFIENISDYYNDKRNSDIKELTNRHVIDDYKKFRKYIKNGKVSIDLITREINSLDETIQVVSNSKFFLSSEPVVSMYDENCIERLKSLIPELRDNEFSAIRKLVFDINEEEKSLDTNQEILNRFIDARAKLRDASENCQCNNTISINSATCPFCKSQFASKVELMAGFESVDILLREEGGRRLKHINTLKKEFENEIAKVKQVIEKHLGDIKSTDFNMLSSKMSDYKHFVSNNDRIKKVERLDDYLSKTTFNFDTSDADLDADILSSLFMLIGDIKSPEFSSLSQKYDFTSLFKSYNSYFDGFTETDLLDQITKKKQFLMSVVNAIKNTSILEDKKKLKELVSRKVKLDKTRANIDKLKEIYILKRNEYFTSVSLKLRVPLLIYTAKILQDYQNGLGVFIEEKDMRFVPDGDSRLDILNTFSSGQLSGFVIAFLFAMNKLYVKNDSDDIGFILIDDPIQTMDDINIASMIEVMRNDFANKQIIISTHEADKENYILYKFYKNNLLGQSFNVKKELYDFNQ